MPSTTKSAARSAAARAFCFVRAARLAAAYRHRLRYAERAARRESQAWLDRQPARLVPPPEKPSFGIVA